MRTFGGETISEDGKKSQLDQPEARQALQWMYDMMYTYKVGPTSQQVEDNVQAMFLAGKIAVWHGSAHLLPSLKKQIENRFPCRFTGKTQISIALMIELKSDTTPSAE